MVDGCVGKTYMNVSLSNIVIVVWLELRPGQLNARNHIRLENL